jgi:hypothetical protein
MKNAPDVAAMKMRSRIAEAKTLTDSSGLGSFSACLLLKLSVK